MSEYLLALGVSVEIELKMDWQWCKKFIFKSSPYRLIGLNNVNILFNTVLNPF